MAKFIKLTSTANNREVLVNIKLVQTIERNESQDVSYPNASFTILGFGNKDTVHVLENVDQILSRITL